MRSVEFNVRFRTCNEGIKEKLKFKKKKKRRKYYCRRSRCRETFFCVQGDPESHLNLTWATINGKLRRQAE